MSPSRVSCGAVRRLGASRLGRFGVLKWPPTSHRLVSPTRFSHPPPSNRATRKTPPMPRPKTSGATQPSGAAPPSAPAPGGSAELDAAIAVAQGVIARQDEEILLKDAHIASLREQLHLCEMTGGRERGAGSGGGRAGPSTAHDDKLTREIRELRKHVLDLDTALREAEQRHRGDFRNLARTLQRAVGQLEGAAAEVDPAVAPDLDIDDNLEAATPVLADLPGESSLDMSESVEDRADSLAREKRKTLRLAVWDLRERVRGAVEERGREEDAVEETELRAETVSVDNGATATSLVLSEPSAGWINVTAYVDTPEADNLDGVAAAATPVPAGLMDEGILHVLVPFYRGIGEPSKQSLLSAKNFAAQISLSHELHVATDDSIVTGRRSIPDSIHLLHPARRLKFGKNVGWTSYNHNLVVSKPRKELVAPRDGNWFYLGSFTLHGGPVALTASEFNALSPQAQTRILSLSGYDRPKVDPAERAMIPARYRAGELQAVKFEFRRVGYNHEVAEKIFSAFRTGV